MSRTTDIILELSRSNITPDSSFSIKYSNGALNVNLALLLPCSESDFKRLTAFIDKIDVYSDLENAVCFIWRYVYAMNAELNRIKETYPAGDTKSRAECQKLINKYEKYMQILNNQYSYMLPEAETEKTPEKRQRAKSADIYTMQADTRSGNAPYIKMYSGKIITAPDGVHYGVYKADKGYYKIIDLYTGLSVGASGHSVAECIELLTADLCARVAECRTKDNYKIYLSNFAEAMTAAGYADFIIPYSAADPEPAPEPDNTYLPAETETAPETPETAENAPEEPIIEFNPELLEIARYFFYAVYSDTLSADGVQYSGSECGTRGNRLRIYISGSEYETPETVHSNTELYSFMIENILNAEDYSYLSGIGQHYYELLEAYTPEPPAPEPTTGAGAPAGMQAETTGGTAGTPETTTAATAAGIAPAHYITAFSLSMADYIHIYRAGADMSHRTRQNAPRYITAALYPDPVIIAGIPPALYNLPRRNKTASALLYSTPAFMRHRRHAARIDTIGRAPPALKRTPAADPRQELTTGSASRKTPARYILKRARTRQNGMIYPARYR